jgi:hypothetical protein
MTQLKFDVFGRAIGVQRRADGWEAHEVSGHDKRRRAEGIFVPSTIAEDDIERWLADLCHESATPGHPSVRCLP